MSNILAIPLIDLVVETGNTEDWIDSIKYLVDTGVPEDEMPQLDIRGITFDMEVRHSVDDHAVVLAASTADGSLFIGTPPAFGFLIFNISYVEMRNMIAGSYVADVIARDDLYTRVIAKITLTVFEGVTKQPVNKRIVVEAA
jgi:hypothetical protein